MKPGRILKTLGSETKNFITHDTISSTNISISVLVPLALCATGVTQMDGCTCSGLLHSCGTAVFGELTSLIANSKSKSKDLLFVQGW